MINLLNALIPYLSLFLTCCVAIGAFLAYQQGYSKEAAKIQERVSEARKAENEILVDEVKHLEIEITRLKRIVETIRYALKQRGIEIRVEGDFVMLQDIALAKTQTIALQAEKREDIPPL